MYPSTRLILSTVLLVLSVSTAVFLVLSTELLVFSTEFLVLSTVFLIFSPFLALLALFAFLLAVFLVLSGSSVLSVFLETSGLFQSSDKALSVVRSLFDFAPNSSDVSSFKDSSS